MLQADTATRPVRLGHRPHRGMFATESFRFGGGAGALCSDARFAMRSARALSSASRSHRERRCAHVHSDPARCGAGRAPCRLSAYALTLPDAYVASRAPRIGLVDYSLPQRKTISLIVVFISVTTIPASGTSAYQGRTNLTIFGARAHSARPQPHAHDPGVIGYLLFNERVLIRKNAQRPGLAVSDTLDADVDRCRARRGSDGATAAPHLSHISRIRSEASLSGVRSAISL